LFIPLRHENNEGRRWPIITISIILLNLVIFLGTHGRIDAESAQRTEVQAHLIMLAAMHPDLTMTPEAQAYIGDFQKKNPGLWHEAQSETRDLADAWDARIRLTEDVTVLQGEMDSLSEQFSSLQRSSVLEKYAFVPAHPSAISYISAAFLHGGWLHLIGNMWFLWLAGAILEDTWGRITYPLFYLAAGIVANVFHAWFNPGSTVPAFGASGAVAALMGAFLVRYARTKIEIAVVIGPRSLANLALGRGIRFKAAAYWLLPLWLVMEIFSGALFGASSGVAHWAHVGGFVFGALAAAGIQHSGLEKHVSAAIDAKVSWTAAPAITQATEQMEQGKLDQAVSTLQAHLAANPNSLEAYSILPQILWRKNDVTGFQSAIIKRCQLHLKAHNSETAWQDYEEYANSGGNSMPASTWLELCRAAESMGQLDRAVQEYEQLAATHPNQKESVLALMAAGRLCLKRLNRPADALRNYKAAQASTVPHLDWDSNIQAGLEQAERASSPSTVAPLH